MVSMPCQGRTPAERTHATSCPAAQTRRRTRTTSSCTTPTKTGRTCEACRRSVVPCGASHAPSPRRSERIARIPRKELQDILAEAQKHFPGEFQPPSALEHDAASLMGAEDLHSVAGTPRRPTSANAVAASPVGMSAYVGGPTLRASPGRALRTRAPQRRQAAQTRAEPPPPGTALMQALASALESHDSDSSSGASSAFSAEAAAAPSRGALHRVSIAEGSLLAALALPPAQHQASAVHGASGPGSPSRPSRSQRASERRAAVQRHKRALLRQLSERDAAAHVLLRLQEAVVGGVLPRHGEPQNVRVSAGLRGERVSPADARRAILQLAGTPSHQPAFKQILQRIPRPLRQAVRGAQMLACPGRLVRTTAQKVDEAVHAGRPQLLAGWMNFFTQDQSFTLQAQMHQFQQLLLTLSLVTSARAHLGEHFAACHEAASRMLGLRSAARFARGCPPIYRASDAGYEGDDEGPPRPAGQGELHSASTLPATGGSKRRRYSDPQRPPPAHKAPRHSRSPNTPTLPTSARYAEFLDEDSDSSDFVPDGGSVATVQSSAGATARQPLKTGEEHPRPEAPALPVQSSRPSRTAAFHRPFVRTRQAERVLKEHTVQHGPWALASPQNGAGAVPPSMFDAPLLSLAAPAYRVCEAQFEANRQARTVRRSSTTDECLRSLAEAVRANQAALASKLTVKRSRRDASNVDPGTATARTSRKSIRTAAAALGLPEAVVSAFAGQVQAQALAEQGGQAVEEIGFEFFSRAQLMSTGRVCPVPLRPLPLPSISLKRAVQQLNLPQDVLTFLLSTPSSPSAALPYLTMQPPKTLLGRALQGHKVLGIPPSVPPDSVDEISRSSLRSRVVDPVHDILRHVQREGGVYHTKDAFGNPAAVLHAAAQPQLSTPGGCLGAFDGLTYAVLLRLAPMLSSTLWPQMFDADDMKHAGVKLAQGATFLPAEARLMALGMYRHGHAGREQMWGEMLPHKELRKVLERLRNVRRRTDGFPMWDLKGKDAAQLCLRPRPTGPVYGGGRRNDTSHLGQATNMLREVEFAHAYGAIDFDPWEAEVLAEALAAVRGRPGPSAGPPLSALDDGSYAQHYSTLHGSLGTFLSGINLAQLNKRAACLGAGLLPHRGPALLFRILSSFATPSTSENGALLPPTSGHENPHAQLAILHPCAPTFPPVWQVGFDAEQHSKAHQPCYLLRCSAAAFPVLSQCYPELAPARSTGFSVLPVASRSSESALAWIARLAEAEPEEVAVLGPLSAAHLTRTSHLPSLLPAGFLSLTAQGFHTGATCDLAPEPRKLGSQHELSRRRPGRARPLSSFASLVAGDLYGTETLATADTDSDGDSTKSGTSAPANARDMVELVSDVCTLRGIPRPLAPTGGEVHPLLSKSGQESAVTRNAWTASPFDLCLEVPLLGQLAESVPCLRSDSVQQALRLDQGMTGLLRQALSHTSTPLNPGRLRGLLPHPAHGEVPTDRHSPLNGICAFPPHTDTASSAAVEAWMQLLAEAGDTLDTFQGPGREAAPPQPLLGVPQSLMGLPSADVTHMPVGLNSSGFAAAPPSLLQLPAAAGQQPPQHAPLHPAAPPSLMALRPSTAYVPGDLLSSKPQHDSSADEPHRAPTTRRAMHALSDKRSGNSALHALAASAAAALEATVEPPEQSKQLAPATIHSPPRLSRASARSTAESSPPVVTQPPPAQERRRSLFDIVMQASDAGAHMTASTASEADASVTAAPGASLGKSLALRHDTLGIEAAFDAISQGAHHSSLPPPKHNTSAHPAPEVHDSVDFPSQPDLTCSDKAGPAQPHWTRQMDALLLRGLLQGTQPTWTGRLQATCTALAPHGVSSVEQVEHRWNLQYAGKVRQPLP